MAERQWTMRILAGVHVGAEAALIEEETVLGGDDDCDFALEDEGLASRHISLLAAESGVRLTVLDAGSPVRIDGQRVEGSVLLAPFQVVSIAGLALAVGPAEQSWPPIELPPARADEGDEPQSETADAQPPDRLDADAAASGQGREAQAAPERSRGRMPWPAISVAALLIAAGAAWLMVPDRPEAEPVEPAQAARQIMEIASRHGAEVQVRPGEGPEAPVAVSGHAVADRDVRSLLDELAATGIRAAVHLVSSEQLAEYANAILEQSLNRDGRSQVEALPAADAPGKLVISGYAASASSLAQAKALLAQDLKGAKGLTYRIQTQADRLAVLRRRLDALGLGDRMRIQHLDGGIGLFGPVRSAEELARIRKLAGDFNAEFDARPPLRLDGTDSFLGVSTIDFDVRAVVLGERLHVIAQDGASYAEGSRIAGGYVVKTITERYMILERPVKVDEPDVAGDSGIAYVVFDGA